MKTPPSSPVNVNAKNFSTPINSKEKQEAPPVIRTKTELLDCLFSEENVKNKDVAERYSNSSYMRDPNTSNKRAMFKKGDKNIGLKYQYHRYTISTLDTLFADYEANELQLSSAILSQQSQPQPQLQRPVQTQALPPLTFFPKERQSLPAFSLPKLDITADNERRPLPAFSLPKLDITVDNERRPLPAFPLPMLDITVDNERRPSPAFPLPKLDITVDNDEDISFLDDLSKTVDCRFVVVNSAQKTQHMYFSIGDGADGLSHAQTALGKEIEGGCVSAGVITFVKGGSGWTIKSLSNKSGHFKTGLGALLNPIGIILNLMDSYLTDNITITPYSPVAKTEPFTLPVAALREKYNEAIPLLQQCLCLSEPAIECLPQEYNDLDKQEQTSTDVAATNGTIRKELCFGEGQDNFTLFSPKKQKQQGEVIKLKQKHDDDTHNNSLSTGF